ncbi:MAG: hypothetical protein NXI10_10950 [bacterium]|nr:hypothetical protein [bacterium]
MNNWLSKSFVIVGLILVGCSFHRGSLESSSSDEPVEHVDMAMGVSTTVKVFGIGSTNKDALIQEARQKMIINRPLENDEVYGQITTDVKNTWFLFVNKQKVTMTADIVIPKEDPSTPTYTQKYLEQLQYGQSIYDTLFQIGDTVIIDLTTKAEVIGYEGSEGQKLRVQFNSNSGKLKNKVVRAQGAFVIVNNYDGSREVKEEMGKGKIIAFGVSKDLYRGKDGLNYKYSSN